MAAWNSNTGNPINCTAFFGGEVSPALIDDAVMRILRNERMANPGGALLTDEAYQLLEVMIKNRLSVWYVTSLASPYARQLKQRKISESGIVPHLVAAQTAGNQTHEEVSESFNRHLSLARVDLVAGARLTYVFSKYKISVDDVLDYVHDLRYLERDGLSSEDQVILAELLAAKEVTSHGLLSLFIGFEQDLTKKYRSWSRAQILRTATRLTVAHLKQEKIRGTHFVRHLTFIDFTSAWDSLVRDKEIRNLYLNGDQIVDLYLAMAEYNVDDKSIIQIVTAAHAYRSLTENRVVSFVRAMLAARALSLKPAL